VERGNSFENEWDGHSNCTHAGITSEISMEPSFEQTVADMRMLLRDEPSCTTADVTDGTALYLSGNELRGVFLNPDEPDGLDVPFHVDAWFVGQIEENLKDWFERPRLTHRPLLQEWSLDAPPMDFSA
jgi:hypothetical protein